MPDFDSSAEDALRGLEARLERATHAAEQLMGEAAESIRTRRVPPAGWTRPADPEETSGSLYASELELLLSFAQRIRELIPADLERRLADALRELLLAVRALIDWYLERIERRRAEPVEVTDIPIS